MTHPGEQFYPEGVHWDDPIAQGTLPDLLSKAAGEFGARPAIEYRDRPIGYAELEAMVEVAAAAFLRGGYGKNNSVALFLGNSPDHPVNFFGALKAGARIVHLSPLDGAIALSHKLSDSGARVLVTSDLATLLPTALKFLEKGLLDRLIVCEDDHWGAVGNPHTPIPDNPAIVTFKKFTAGVTKPAQWPAISADDVALLQYTGGTTGLPKGAMLTHGNLTSAVSIYDVWGKPARAERNAIERVICVLPLFHIFALTVVMLSSLERGNLISLHQRFDIEAVMRDIEVKRATAFPGVPTMWIAIASLPDLDKRDLSSLVSCGSGGAPLPVEVARIFERKVGMKLKSGWGMTETCSPGTGHPKEGPDKPGSIGLMLPGIEMDVVALDDPKKILPVGEVGEIRIRGPNVTKGYWLFLSGRPQEGHDHLRRLQCLSADDRAGDLPASRGARGDRDRHSRRLSRRGRQGLCQTARRCCAIQPRRTQGLSGRQARQARDSGSTRFRRRPAADVGRKALAPRIAQFASGAAEAAASRSGRPGVMGQPFVVPANAGTHTPRILCSDVAAEAFCYPRTPGVMGPGLRRDDES
jgi:long-chain acyl-CoA synthetase